MKFKITKAQSHLRARKAKALRTPRGPSSAALCAHDTSRRTAIATWHFFVFAAMLPERATSSRYRTTAVDVLKSLPKMRSRPSERSKPSSAGQLRVVSWSKIDPTALDSRWQLRPQLS